MGYTYGRDPSTGREKLACDACGCIGGVRRRTCPHLVTDEYGKRLPYCPAPALCSHCYSARRATLHAECAEPARQSSAEYVVRRKRIAAGDSPVRAAFGDAEGVPDGWTLVLFGLALELAEEHWRIVPSAEYKPDGFLSDHPGARETSARPRLYSPVRLGRVKAVDVRVGDELATGEPAPYNWTRVHDVETSPDGRNVVIHTRAWSTYKHPEEGVLVRRQAVRPEGAHTQSCSAHAGVACDCADSEAT